MDDEFSKLNNEKKEERDWDIITNDSNIKVFRNPKESIFTFKAFSRVSFLILVIYKDVEPGMISFKILEQWDPYYFYEEVVETINENEDILYIQIKTPPGISYRDNCLHRIKKIEGDTFSVIATTISHKKCPVKKEFIRAKTHFHGVIIERAGENNTNVFVYSQQEFGGYIPQFLVNMVSKSRPKEWYTNLNNAIKRFKTSKL